MAMRSAVGMGLHSALGVLCLCGFAATTACGGAASEDSDGLGQSGAGALADGGEGMDGAGGGGGGGDGDSAAGDGGTGGGSGDGDTGGGDGDTGGGDGDDPVDPGTAFPPVEDFAAAGPYASSELTATGPNGNYTVYLPETLSPNGELHPIVGWMSGGSTNPSWYTLLPHLASHGFVVVASNTTPSIGAEVALGQEIIAGIDWAIAENGRAGSPLHGKLDTQALASAGYSMGSLATFTIADDPRLTTTLHISGGNMAPERIENLHAPAAFICGATGGAACNILSADCDIAAVNCDADFQNADTPVFYANFPGGHLGIMTSPFQERIGEMATRWLRLHLMGDGALSTDFEGADCGYCGDPEWTVQQKGL